MNESKNNVSTMYQTIPAVAAMNHVPGFEPMKLLRRTKSRKGNEVVWKLALPYKKLWFRLVNPNGRIKLNALSVTEQMAVYEAQVFLDRNDTNPVSSFTASCSREDMTVENYIRSAQEEAIDEALSLAGFGPQFADVGMTKAEERYGSEIPLSAIPAEKMPTNVSPAAGNNKASQMVQKAVPQMAAKQQAQGSSMASVQSKKPVTGNDVTSAQTARPTTSTAPVTKTVAPGAKIQASVAKEVPVRQAPQSVSRAVPTGNQTSQPAAFAVAPVKQTVTPNQPMLHTQPSVQERLPITPAKEETALPIPPAMQQETPVQEEDSLPVPAAVETKQTTEAQAAEKPMEAVQPTGQKPASQGIVSEAQRAMQILQRSPSAVQTSPAQATSIVTPNQTATATPPKYTRDTPVPEIVKLMTIEEARKVVVDTGTCQGWTMAEVAERRPASLKFYLFGGYKEGNNILLAAARLLYDQMQMQKAG